MMSTNLLWLIAALLLLGTVAALMVALWPDRKDRFGAYRIEGTLGEGGMATVYRARDTSGRQVALKVLHQGAKEDIDLYRKFFQEAEALKQMHQSHRDAPVPKVYASGTEPSQQRPFIAMEYIPGTHLHAWLRQRRVISESVALSIAYQVAYALEAAHTHGVYHRDVKPGNIMLEETGEGVRATLIDFGVARHEYAAYHTLHSSMLGTPPYMPPEIAEGRFDARSDVYSLGVVLYTMLRGSPPFTHNNPLQVLEMHRTKPVPPLPSGVSEGVRSLVREMLQKQPARRPSLSRVQSRLRALQAGPVGARPARTSTAPQQKARRLAPVAAAMTATGLLLFGVYACTASNSFAEEVVAPSSSTTTEAMDGPLRP
jgi:serine/threonine-protein kinase